MGNPAMGSAASSSPHREGEIIDTTAIPPAPTRHPNKVTKSDYSDLWARFADEYLDGQEGEDAISDEEALLEMYRNPININSATKADLLRMPFLTSAQADSIYSKVNQMHGMLSMGELAFIRDLGLREREYMLLFFYCGTYNGDARARSTAPGDRKNRHRANGAWRDAPQAGLTTDISLTIGAPIEKREGFRSHTRSQLEKNPNCQYLGNRLRVGLRYRGDWNNTLRWGFTSAKSEGEPMMEGKNPFLDSYSLFLTGRRWRRATYGVRRWVVGDYRMQMALGLVVGASSPDANTLSLSYRPRQEGLTPHSSTSEALFLRGGAIEMGAGKWIARAFISYLDLDATLKNDSITTILATGYHRTHSEMAKRHNISATQGGIQIGYDFSALSITMQSALTHYNKPYIRPTALYRQHYYTGSAFLNYSLAYSWHLRAVSAQGEAAIDKNGALALQDRWQYAPSNRLKLNLVHRYYSGRYLAPMGQTFRAASLIQNEHGLLLSAAIRPQEMWLIRVWTDLSHHRDPLFRCSQSSNRLTAYAQLSYAPDRHTEYYIRYKYRTRGQDNSNKHLGTRTQHYLKAQAHYTYGIVNMTSAADLTFLREPDKAWRKGWMLSHRAGMTMPLSAHGREEDAPTAASASALYATAAQRNKCASLQINAAAALFHTDAYAEALRFYEPGLLYAFSIPACYYHGLRAAISSLLTMGSFSIGAKYAVTHYTNRSSIGTGLRLYRGSTLQDITLQLRLLL